MEQKGELISYRPDIKVVDCTIRDGGLVNNFYFDDEFVRNLYTANVAAGVEYMEFGYKASKEIFDVKEFGKWKFLLFLDIKKSYDSHSFFIFYKFQFSFYTFLNSIS